MTGVRKLQNGELLALRPGHARLGAGVLGSSPVTDLHNVVQFLRRPPEAPHPAPDVVLPTDAARLPAAALAYERTRLAAFAAISLSVHGALFAAFWRDPDPLASIALEVMSVELVLGATAPAGVAPTPGEQQLQAAAAATDPQPTDPQRAAEQKATEQPQSVQVARAETAPEQTATLERQADERQPDDNAAAPREQRREAEQKPAVAMVESRAPEMATAVPREIPPDAMDVSLLPQPEEKPLEPKPEPKPVQAAPPQPVKNAAPAAERRRIAAPTRERAAKPASASTPSTAANNVGVGRSDNNTNYPGLVSAHLRRHQQYPADARSRGDQGVATLSFSLDGGGRVTSARLLRGSGIASLDHEVQAMVRRASPFPAPPGGRSQSFTVPVSFRLN
jgi:protein TonB